jgi:cob(I)alamin adenosyltransferase
MGALTVRVKNIVDHVKPCHDWSKRAGGQVAKIYTKRGDKGQTTLFGGPSVSKADERLEAYGTLDELNSLLGWIRCDVQAQTPGLEALDQDLKRIQK